MPHVAINVAVVATSTSTIWNRGGAPDAATAASIVTVLAIGR